MQEKPRSTRLLIGCAILFAVIAGLVGLFIARLVQGGAGLLIAALCTVVPIGVPVLLVPASAQWPWWLLSGIQVIGLVGAEFAIYKVSARITGRQPVRLLFMMAGWVLVTTITNALLLGQAIAEAIGSI